MDHWLLPTLISAVALGFYDICKKHAVHGNSVMPVLFLSTFSGTFFFILTAFAGGDIAAYFACTPGELLLIFFKALLVSSSWVCVYYAMRELPISLAAPVRSSSPMWTALGGIILYHEIPNVLQAVGMVVILIGYVIFSFLGSVEGFNWKSRGMVLIILGTVAGAASAVYDKFLLNYAGVDRNVMQMYFSIYMVLVLGGAFLIRSCFGVKHQFCWRWTIPVTGILLILADYVYFYAVSLPDTPISMVSLVRRSMSCIVAFAVGSALFREVNIRRKVCALILLISGIVLLALGKM